MTFRISKGFWENRDLQETEMCIIISVLVLFIRLQEMGDKNRVSCIYEDRKGWRLDETQD